MMLLGGAPAAAAPLRLVEQCRIAATPDLPFAEALAALDRCAQPAPREANGTLWRSYTPPRPMADAPQVWRLRIDNHRTAGLQVHVRAGGAWQRIDYDATAPDREWASGNYFSIPFHTEGPVDRIVIRHDRAIGISLARLPVLMPAREFAAHDRNHALAYGVGVGMLLLTILFHLSLFFAMRRRFQLIYCIHVCLLLLYALCYSGGIRIVAPGLAADGVSRLLGLSMALATATGISFVVEFMGAAMLPRRLVRWTRISALGSVAAGVSYVVAPLPLVAAVFHFGHLAALNTLLTTAVLLAVGFARKLPTARTLAIGWALPIGVSLLYPLRAMGLVDSTAVPDGLMMAAATLECLILSLPVAGRIRHLRVEHERAQERHLLLERQALTDSLTGLANRRGFRDALDRAGAGLPGHAVLGLLVIDIDHFKRVNDRYGHGTGDAILQHVAAHVARVAGPGAIVARHGGEEFVVALTGHDLARAGTIAERIRASVGASFDPDAMLPAVTVSIGVAAGPIQSVAELLGEADRALYRAKDAGRNRVMLARSGGAARSAAA